MVAQRLTESDSETGEKVRVEEAGCIRNTGHRAPKPAPEAAAVRARVRRRTGPLAELDAHLPGEQSALAPLAGVPSGCAGFTPRVAAYPPRPRRYEEKDLRNLSAFSYLLVHCFQS